MSCSEDHSYTEIRHPDGCTKSCKMTPKCITNQREMTMKKHKFRCCNAQKRTPSTELRTCMKTRSFLSFPCCVAQKTNFKIIQSHREFIPNARREAGQFGVYCEQKNQIVNNDNYFSQHCKCRAAVPTSCIVTVSALMLSVTALLRIPRASQPRISSPRTTLASGVREEAQKPAHVRPWSPDSVPTEVPLNTIKIAQVL